MKIVILDSTAVRDVTSGVGSPAYFSRFAVDHLRKAGHEITILDKFDMNYCAAADVVWSEWCLQEAFDAAASKVCKKLVLRMRGFDVWLPLDKLAWESVDCLVYESEYMRKLTLERFPQFATLSSLVIPSGIDVAAIPFKEHTPPRHPATVALVARAIADKGHALAMEWARQNPRITLHMTTALGELNPRFVRYIDRMKPSNVFVHGNVNTIPWLEEVGADYLLSASDWETLGYSIAEACAMGIKPLIHDAPGCAEIWPNDLLWRGFDDLNKLILGPYESHRYRKYVEDNFDAKKRSAEFAELVLAPSTRPAQAPIELRAAGYAERSALIEAVGAAVVQPVDIRPIARAVEEYRGSTTAHTPDSLVRYALAMGLGIAYWNRDDLARAEQWACRALLDYPRPDAFALLGEVADARGDVEEAVEWYRAACAVGDRPNRYRVNSLVDNRYDRRNELHDKLAVPLPPPRVPRVDFHVVVTVRNGQPWIGKCLRSIATQDRPFKCTVVDDASTDGTQLAIEDFRSEAPNDQRFEYVFNTERAWQAQNTFVHARRAATPDTVVVLVDGDDWLAHSGVLTLIAMEYLRGAWATYGGCQPTDGTPPQFDLYPQRIAQTGNFQDWLWCGTQPRSFRRFLVDQLSPRDLTVDGEWPKVAGDVCVFLPILQMACERAVGIRDILYRYNVETLASDHKQDPWEQVRVRDALMGRPQKNRYELP